MIIQNKEQLATNQLRRDALEILEAGLEAIETEKILRRKIEVKDGVLNIDGYFLNLKDYQKVIFVGIGKCALDGARVIENILGDFLTEGIALDVKSLAEAPQLAKIRYFQGTHPLPSEQNVAATREILKMVEGLTEKDLVLTLISGGGSALFELPNEGVTLEDIINKTKELTAQGADIYELNKVRKEMSQVKGGKFARGCSPAQVVSLLFSDVLGNDISVIASGPTVLSDFPSPLQGEGHAQARGEVEARVKNILLVSNTDALEAMQTKAEELGYSATIETDRFSGDAAEKGKELAIRDLQPQACILLGGETTVKLGEGGKGEGGRNQELVLAALEHIKPNTVLISASSDGWDNTDHAGALADIELLEKSKQMNLNPEEFLQRSDSYDFFKSCGGAISTGRLGSNVSDLVIIIHE